MTTVSDEDLNRNNAMPWALIVTSMTRFTCICLIISGIFTFVIYPSVYWIGIYAICVPVLLMTLDIWMALDKCWAWCVHSVVSVAVTPVLFLHISMVQVAMLMMIVDLVTICGFVMSVLAYRKESSKKKQETVVAENIDIIASYV